jgi:hypothetical protein
MVRSSSLPLIKRKSLTAGAKFKRRMIDGIWRIKGRALKSLFFSVFTYMHNPYMRTAAHTGNMGKNTLGNAAFLKTKNAGTGIRKIIRNMMTLYRRRGIFRNILNAPAAAKGMMKRKMMIKEKYRLWAAAPGLVHPSPLSILAKNFLAMGR